MEVCLLLVVAGVLAPVGRTVTRIMEVDVSGPAWVTWPFGPMVLPFLSTTTTTEDVLTLAPSGSGSVAELLLLVVVGIAPFCCVVVAVSVRKMVLSGAVVVSVLTGIVCTVVTGLVTVVGWPLMLTTTTT